MLHKSIFDIECGDARLNPTATKTLRAILAKAMAEGVTNALRDMAWLVGIIDAAAPPLKPRVPYKKAQKS